MLQRHARADKAFVGPLLHGIDGLMKAAEQTPQDGAAALSAAARHGALLRAVATRQDQEAFAELFAHFAPRIKSFLMKGGASPDAADELAQETMLSVWQKAASFDPAKASAATWIFTIARNRRIDALRRKTQSYEGGADPELIEDDRPNAVDSIAQAQETETMATAIQSLPPEQADLLYKSFFENKTHADIAKDTRLPLGTVKSRIRIALDKLRADRAVRGLR